MEYIHIKSIEKYQPQYKDGRKLLWIRWDISALRDYKITKLSSAGKWLFVVLICLETEAQGQVPCDVQWLHQQSGIPKKHIPKEIKMLQTLELIVTSCNKLCPTDIHTDIHTDIDERNRFDNFCKVVVEAWNALAKDYSTLQQVQGLSVGRRKHLKARFNEEAFVDRWTAILQGFRDSAWLRGEVNDKEGKPFKGGFDWIIANDNNYLKVLEGKYSQQKVKPTAKYGGKL